jgi:hypothetical protein
MDLKIRHSHRALAIVFLLAGAVIMASALRYFESGDWKNDFPLPCISLFALIVGVCVFCGAIEYSFDRGSKTCVETVRFFGYALRRKEFVFDVVEVVRPHGWVTGARNFVYLTRDRDRGLPAMLMLGRYRKKETAVAKALEIAEVTGARFRPVG